MVLLLPAATEAPQKPCLNFLTGLLPISIDWGRPRTLVYHTQVCTSSSKRSLLISGKEPRQTPVTKETERYFIPNGRQRLQASTSAAVPGSDVTPKFRFLLGRCVALSPVTLRYTCVRQVGAVVAWMLWIELCKCSGFFPRVTLGRRASVAGRRSSASASRSSWPPTLLPHTRCYSVRMYPLVWVSVCWGGLRGDGEQGRPCVGAAAWRWHRGVGRFYPRQ